MNTETSNSASKESTPQAPPIAEGSSLLSAARTGSLQKITAIACTVLAVLVLVQWWSSYTETSALRGELARRLQVGDTANTETKQLASTAQEGMKELQAKVAALEAKQAETQSQQLALAQMYQDMSKNRDDWALSEVEQVLSTAAQQLQLSGNVQGALIALQNADKSLARLDKPQFLPIRRAIAKDVERLKSLPNVDLAGIALRLDTVIGQVDKLPLFADEKPVTPAIQPKGGRAAPEAEKAETKAAQTATRGKAFMDWWHGMQNKWHSWSSEMWGEFRQLVQVRSVEKPDALLVSPNQAYFIRENLKLRLLNARQALLSRNEATFRSDVHAAQDVVGKYFDTLAKQTQSVQAILKQVQSSDLVIEMPTLESLNAIHGFKTKS